MSTHLKHLLRNIVIGAAVVVPAWLASPAVASFLQNHAATATIVGLAVALLETFVHSYSGTTAAGGQ